MSVPPPDSSSRREPDPPADDRPDWLVGAEEGVLGEMSRTRGESPPLEVKLTRPAGPEDAPAPRAPRRAGGTGSGSADFGALDLTDATPDMATSGESLRLADRTGGAPPAGRGSPASKAPPEPAKPEAWKAAASSVPTLRREPGRVIPLPPLARATGATTVDDEDAGAALDFPDDAGPAIAAVPPAPAARHRDAWWAVALDELTHNRKLQILIGVLAVLAVGVPLLWPRENPGASIAELRRHPHRWDNRGVTVRGRVAEVFPLGGGYAYYLLQGRDTLVVFTRASAPERRRSVTVSGTIQTGYLDGQPRQALFENP